MMEPMFHTPTMGRKKGYNVNVVESIKDETTQHPVRANHQEPVKDSTTKSHRPAIHHKTSRPRGKMTEKAYLTIAALGALIFVLLIAIIWQVTQRQANALNKTIPAGAKSIDDDGGFEPEQSRKAGLPRNFSLATEGPDEVVTPHVTEDEVCTTTECNELAKMVQALMDPRKNPCEDFYQFACGGSTTDRRDLVLLPEEDVRQKIIYALKHQSISSSKPWQLMKGFFSQCVNNRSSTEERLERFVSAVNEIGFSFNQTGGDLTTLLARMIQRNSAPIFDILPAVDWTDPYRLVFQLVPPHQSSSFTQQSLAEGQRRNCSLHLAADKHHQINTGQLYHDYKECLERRSYTMEVIRQALTHFMDETDNQALRIYIELDILRQIAESLPEEGELRRILMTKDYQEMTIENMNSEFPGIDWHTFFRLQGGSENVSMVGDVVQVYFPDYLKKLTGLLTRKGDETLSRNALLALYAAQIYHDVVLDVTKTEESCVDVAANLMPDVALSLYWSNFDDRKRQEMKGYLNHVSNLLKTTLPELMKENAEKIHSMRLDFLDGGSFLLMEKDWQNFTLSSNYEESLFALVKRRREVSVRAQLERLHNREPDSVSALCFDRSAMNCFSSGQAIYARNSIIFPLSILGNDMMYSSKYPAYWVMGKVGYLMAHEMMHIFDLIGIKFGASTPNNNTSAELMGTMERIKRWIANYEQNSTMHEQIVLPKLNVDLLANEIYADEESLTLAWETYVRHISGSSKTPEEKLKPLPLLNLKEEQLFFLASAQIFCPDLPHDLTARSLSQQENLPAQLRVRGLVANSDAFRKAYQCPNQVEPSEGDRTWLDEIRDSLNDTYSFSEDDYTEEIVDETNHDGVTKAWAISATSANKENSSSPSPHHPYTDGKPGELVPTTEVIDLDYE